MASYDYCSWCKTPFKSHRAEVQNYYKNINTGRYGLYRFHSMKCYHQFIDSGSYVVVNSRGETGEEAGERLKRENEVWERNVVKEYGSMKNYRNHQRYLQQKQINKEKNIKTFVNVILPIIFIILFLTVLDDISWLAVIILGGALLMDTRIGLIALTIYTFCYIFF